MSDTPPSTVTPEDEALAAIAFAVRPPSDDWRRADVEADGAALTSVTNAVAALGLDEAPAAPASTLRARLLASVGRGGRYGKFCDRVARLFDLSVADAEALLARLEAGDAWSPFLVPGIDVIPVAAGPKFAGGIALIARIPPGVRFPDHVHKGEERMFILDGGLREDGGAEVWRGDELVSADGSAHTFVAVERDDARGPCIAATLVEGVVDFR